ncbi:MAG: site-2 protease family protein [Patescibacteria group bacterium]
MSQQSLLLGFLIIVIILMSLSVHEFAHAFTANLFGDPTAKNEGRMTLNPFKHWDTVGTTLLVGLLALRALGLSSVPAFGWGKPVPVNEGNFENPRLHGIQTALAGPMSNFILAMILALIVRVVNLPELVGTALILAVYVNIFLMFFNLLPIPPLDGSRILRLFMSEQAYYGLASNPLFLIGGIFVVLYLLADLLVQATTYLTTLLIGG